MKLHFTPQYFKNPTHPINVCLIGVGGTGSLVLSRLARIDYALREMNHPGLFVTAFDDDKVEPFNVGRQNFTPADVYEYKALALISKINTAFGLSWTAVNEKFVPNKELEANIFITCVDNANFREEFNLSFLSNKSRGFDFNKSYYWLDLGNSRKSGQIILGSKFIEQPKSKTFETLNKLPTIIERFGELSAFDTEELQGASCSYKAKLNEQSLFINDAIAVYAADLIFELIYKGFISYQGAFINLENLKSNPVQLN